MAQIASALSPGLAALSQPGKVQAMRPPGSASLAGSFADTDDAGEEAAPTPFGDALALATKLPDPATPGGTSAVGLAAPQEAAAGVRRPGLAAVSFGAVAGVDGHSWLMRPAAFLGGSGAGLPAKGAGRMLLASLGRADDPTDELRGGASQPKEAASQPGNPVPGPDLLPLLVLPPIVAPQAAPAQASPAAGAWIAESLPAPGSSLPEGAGQSPAEPSRTEPAAADGAAASGATADAGLSTVRRDTLAGQGAAPLATTVLPLVPPAVAGPNAAAVTTQPMLRAAATPDPVAGMAPLPQSGAAATRLRPDLDLAVPIAATAPSASNATPPPALASATLASATLASAVLASPGPTGAPVAANGLVGLARQDSAAPISQPVAQTVTPFVAAGTAPAIPAFVVSSAAAGPRMMASSAATGGTRSEPVASSGTGTTGGPAEMDAASGGPAPVSSRFDATMTAEAGTGIAARPGTMPQGIAGPSPGHETAGLTIAPPPHALADDAVETAAGERLVPVPGSLQASAPLAAGPGILPETVAELVQPIPGRAMPDAAGTAARSGQSIAAPAPGTLGTMPGAMPGAVPPAADVAPSQAAPPALANTPALPHPVLDQVARPILAAVHSGDAAQRLTVSITPDELGRVNITIGRNADGTMHIHVSADQLATLDLLRRDQGELARTLDQAGSGPNGHSLSFSFDGNTADSGTGGSMGWGQDGRNHPPPTFGASGGFPGSYPDASADASPPAHAARLPGASGIDVTA